MSSGTAHTLSAGSGVTVWPTLLDLSKDDCKRILRSLELQAYASVVSAFRAQGDLNKDKRKALLELQRLLSISTERHRAEVRRAVNDEKLATIADHMSGPSMTCDWVIEGRRLVPLMPRLVPQTVFSAVANQAGIAQAEKNAQMPSPAHTVSHGIVGSIPVIKEDEDVVAVPIAAAGERRWPAQPAVVGAYGAVGGSGDAPSATVSSSSATVTSCMITKAPVVTTKVVSPAGIQTPMKITVSKPQLSSGAAQKLILVNAGHGTSGTAGGAGTPTKSLSNSTVTLTKPATGGSFSTGTQPKTSVVYPAAQAHTSSVVSGAVTGSSSSLAVQHNQNAYAHSLTIARPRPKTAAGTGSQPISITTTHAARLRVPGPSASSTLVTSMMQSKATGGAVATAGPQPVSPVIGSMSRPPIGTSAVSITAKPGIQIKQEGAMKIITSSGSKLLPKPAGGAAAPIVVVTSSTATTSPPAGSTINTTIARPVASTGQVQISAGKVINFGGCRVVSASSSTSSAAASLVAGGKAPASIIAANAGQRATAASAVSSVKSGTALSTGAAATLTPPAAMKSCTVIVQNQQPRQTVATSVTASALPARLIKSAELPTQQVTASAELHTGTTALVATPVTGTRAAEVKPPTSKAEGPPELSLISRPSILAGLMQSDTASTSAGPPLSPHVILDHVVVVPCEGTSVSAGQGTVSDEDLWLLSSSQGQVGPAVVVCDDSTNSAEESQKTSDSCVVAVTSNSAESIQGKDLGSQVQTPQFDIFSSALAEAQIDLNPYEYSDDGMTAADDTVTTWTTSVASAELITVVDSVAIEDSGTGDCLVSDGSSTLLAGAETCVGSVTVAEYQEVSAELVQAISQCAAEGVTLTVVDSSGAEQELVTADMAISSSSFVVPDEPSQACDGSMQCVELDMQSQTGETGDSGAGNALPDGSRSTCPPMAEPQLVVGTSSQECTTEQPSSTVESILYSEQHTVDHGEIGTGEAPIVSTYPIFTSSFATMSAVPPSEDRTLRNTGSGSESTSSIVISPATSVVSLTMASDVSSSGCADSIGGGQRKRKAVDFSAYDEGPSVIPPSAPWVKSAIGLMHKVMKFRGANRNKGEHNASAWFLRPVSDDEAPGYSAVVTTPMDFGTIKKKLETGAYSGGIEQFHADVLLVRTNCSMYNPPEHSVRRDCDEVMAYYEREFERTFARSPAAYVPPSTSVMPSSAEQVLSPKRMRVSGEDCGPSA